MKGLVSNSREDVCIAKILILVGHIRVKLFHESRHLFPVKLYPTVQLVFVNDLL